MNKNMEKVTSDEEHQLIDENPRQQVLNVMYDDSAEPSSNLSVKNVASTREGQVMNDLSVTSVEGNEESNISYMYLRDTTSNLQLSTFVDVSQRPTPSGVSERQPFESENHLNTERIGLEEDEDTPLKGYYDPPPNNFAPDEDTERKEMNIPELNFNKLKLEPEKQDCLCFKGKDSDKVRDMPQDMLDELAMQLETDFTGCKNWRHIASRNKVKNQIIDHLKQRQDSPFKSMLKLPQFNDYTIESFKKDLNHYQRKDVVAYLDEFVPDECLCHNDGG